MRMGEKGSTVPKFVLCRQACRLQDRERDTGHKSQAASYLDIYLDSR